MELKNDVKTVKTTFIWHADIRNVAIAMNHNALLLKNAVNRIAELEELLKSQVDSGDTFMNKPCVSSEVCEHDKNAVLDKIRAEIVARDSTVKAIRGDDRCFFTAGEVLKIIDKYKAESEDEEK